MAEMVEFICKECGKKQKRPKYCKYLGMVHGRGWTYVCECKGEMRFVSECEKTLNKIGAK